MHHALEIQEILSNIFGCCYPSDLPSLARTCRAFKEPALDVLWEELVNLSPLAQCLPASHQSQAEGDKAVHIWPNSEGIVGLRNDNLEVTIIN